MQQRRINFRNLVVLNHEKFLMTNPMYSQSPTRMHSKPKSAITMENDAACGTVYFEIEYPIVWSEKEWQKMGKSYDFSNLYGLMGWEVAFLSAQCCAAFTHSDNLVAMLSSLSLSTRKGRFCNYWSQRLTKLICKIVRWHLYRSFVPVRQRPMHNMRHHFDW